MVWVEFGPSRSKRFVQAVAEAETGAGECVQLEPGRYRVRFELGEDASPYRSLARLLGRIRGWRASETYDEDGTLSLHNTREMAWCASSQLSSFGACRFRFYYGVFPRCSACPLFDPRRALLDSLGENRPDPIIIEINLLPNRWRTPDFLPKEWTTPAGE